GILAHVKWFTDPRQHPTQYDLLLSWPVIGAFAVALAATAVAYLIQHRVPEPKAIRSLERYAKTGPLALRIALGVALLAAAAADWLFVPSLDARRGAGGSLERQDAPAAAINLLRLAMGFGIGYGALTEKLLNPPLAQALLNQSPFLNILRPFGVGDPVFIWLAGLTELAVGVVILSGQITRPVMATGFALFTVTLIVFGLPELIGHLPYYGIMLTLFIAPDADSWQMRRSLRRAA